MKNKWIKKIYIFAVCFLLIFTMIGGCLPALSFMVFAEDGSTSNSTFSGIAGSPNGSALYNATNTYIYNGDNTERNRDHVYYNTSEEGEIVASVSNDAPQITVLTHGLGGSASHWSNNEEGDFAKDDSSLFMQIDTILSNNNGVGANIYWAKMGDAQSFKLYDLKNTNNVDENTEETNNNQFVGNETISSITDISKHIIVVFQSSNPDGYNYEVYEEFNYMLSKIVYDVKTLNGDVLPRINLIGHSRGGLTNLMYALDHPDLVASIFSLGTPYFGSNSASTCFGGTFTNNANGLEDIIDEDIYNGYYNRWTRDYNRLYAGINAHALGGYSDIDYLFDALIEADLVEMLIEIDGFENLEIDEEQLDVILEGLKWIPKSLPELIYLIDTVSEVADFFGTYFIEAEYNELELESWLKVMGDIQFVADDPNQNFWEDLWDGIINNIRFVGCPYFMNDLLVNLSSQIGYDEYGNTNGSYGFTVYTKCFRGDDYSGKVKKLSKPTMPAVVHNIEARDTDMINYILTNISLGGVNEGFLYTQTSETTATLSGYRGSVLSGAVSLPAQIDGLTIDRITSDLFKGLGKNITSISIPATVKYIDNNAFLGMSSLSAVEIMPASNLIEIGNRAFEGCIALESFNIPEKVTNVACDAFLGCESLSVITVATENTVYSAVDGVLFNKSATELLCYPQAKTGTTYVVPSTVTEIVPLAFCGNDNLESIDLQNVQIIRQYAFADCSKLSVITTSKLDFVEINVFYGTAWITAQNDNEMIKLGNVLIKYNGTDSDVSIENVVSIAPMAFAQNETLESITFDNDLINIGNASFFACTNLESVYIYNTNQIVYISNVSFDNNAENRRFYVPSSIRASYVGNEFWKRYKDDIRISQTLITFNANGGTSEVITDRVYYLGYLDLPVPTKTGYEFTGWYSNENCTGSIYNEYTRWNSLEENVTFYAGWSIKTYSIIYATAFTESGDILESYSKDYTIENSVVFDIPEKEGYIFIGWYNDYDLTQSVGTELETGSAGNQTFYAKWVGTTYSVTYNLNDDTQFPGSINKTTDIVMFGVVDNQFAVPTRMGFTFNGWKVLINGAYKFYTDEIGVGIRVWDIADDVTVVADWTRNTYYLGINSNGDVEWIGEDGLNSTGTSIEYGTVFESVSDLETSFNPENISLKEGHKFDGFQFPNGEKFTQWEQIATYYESGDTVELIASFIPEVNFCINYLDSEFLPLVADFGSAIELAKQENSTGHTFSHWVVAPVSEASGNARFVGTPFEPGEKEFIYTEMPDLSYGIEGDMVTICLKAVQVPNQYQVTLTTAFGEVSPDVIMVEYGKHFTLPIPSDVEHRFFTGWCYNDQLTRGRIVPPQITDADGKSLSTWQYTENITLDAVWITTGFSIIYDLDGGSYEEGVTNPDHYIIDNTFTLNNPIKDDYRFMGWLNEDTGDIFLKMTIPEGSSGVKRFTAQWEKEYTLTFTANDLSADDITYNGEYATIKAIYGEVVLLADVEFGGFILKAGSAYYQQSASYIVTGDESFELVEKNRVQLYDRLTGYYEIWTYNQLNNIVRAYPNDNYIMMSHITQPADTIWMPISTFNGNFNGNGYGIYNFSIVYSIIGSTISVEKVNYGLFEINFGTIENLEMTQSSISLCSYTANYSNIPVCCGFIVAKNFGTISSCKIYRSFVQFSNIESSIESRSGAICGYNEGTINSCEVFEVGIQLTTGFGGGIVGYNKEGTITNCKISLSTVSCYYEFEKDTEDGYNSGHYAAIGGIVGFTESGTISSCEVASDVNVNYNGFSSNSRVLAPEMGIIAGRSTEEAIYSENISEGAIESVELKTISWTTGTLWWKETHTWDQSKYVGGIVGRYI